MEKYQNWTLTLDSGHGTDVIYVNCRKAFGSIIYCRLAQKLASYGLNGKLLKWLTDFLSDCLQRMVLNGEVSEWLEVTSGVPKGSILRPLLCQILLHQGALHV